MKLASRRNLHECPRSLLINTTATSFTHRSAINMAYLTRSRPFHQQLAIVPFTAKPARKCWSVGQTSAQSGTTNPVTAIATARDSYYFLQSPVDAGGLW